jgi:hypothetical protein
MSLLPDLRPNDQELTRYVLGLLPDEDAEHFDEITIVDDEAASRLRMVEQDLVDRYVRGTLTGETLTRFESHYLSSSRRLENVRFAAGFLHAVDRARTRGQEALRALDSSVDATTRRSAWRRPGAARWMPSRAALASSLAAVAVLLLVARATLIEGVRPGARSGASELSAVQGSAPAQGAAPRSDTAPGMEMATLVLLPQTRALGSIPTLAIPQGSNRAALELRLESSEFLRYQAALKDPAANQIVWRSGWLAPQASGDRPSVPVAIPASLLKPQHYALDLVGRTAAGGAEVAGSYAFQIVPR